MEVRQYRLDFKGAEGAVILGKHSGGSQLAFIAQ